MKRKTVKPSGAANRQRRREKLVDELLVAAEAEHAVDALRRRLMGATATGDGAVADSAAEFEALGPPPLDSPGTALGWVRQAQLVALWQTIRSPAITDEKRWRLVRELSAAVGLTAQRTELEELAERLEDSLRAIAPSPGAQARPVTAAHARPPTSRGGGRSRGPRPVPGGGAADE